MEIPYDLIAGRAIDFFPGHGVLDYLKYLACCTSTAYMARGWTSQLYLIPRWWWLVYNCSTTELLSEAPLATDFSSFSMFGVQHWQGSKPQLGLALEPLCPARDPRGPWISTSSEYMKGLIGRVKSDREGNQT